MLSNPRQTIHRSFALLLGRWQLVLSSTFASQPGLSSWLQRQPRLYHRPDHAGSLEASLSIEPAIFKRRSTRFKKLAICLTAVTQPNGFSRRWPIGNSEIKRKPENGTTKA